MRPHSSEGPGVSEILQADAPRIKIKEAQVTKESQGKTGQWGISRPCQSGPLPGQEPPRDEANDRPLPQKLLGGSGQGGQEKITKGQPGTSTCQIWLEMLRFSRQWLLCAASALVSSCLRQDTTMFTRASMFGNLDY